MTTATPMRRKMRKSKNVVRASAQAPDIHPNAAFADEVRKRQDISESADQVEKLQSLLMSRANRSELEERKIYRSSSALDLSHGSSTLRATVGDDETAQVYWWIGFNTTVHATQLPRVERTSAVQRFS